MLNVFLHFLNSFLLCLFFLAALIPQLLQKSPIIVEGPVREREKDLQSVFGLQVLFDTREEIRTPDQLCVRQPLYH